MKTEGLIYVEVPHQMSVKAYAFESEEDLINWFRSTSKPGVGRYEYTRDSWLKSNAEEDMPAELRAHFEQHDSVVEVCLGECSRSEFFAPEQAPTELEVYRDANYDFHADYVLDYERAMELLNSKERPQWCSHHQYFQVLGRVNEAAQELGWVEAPTEEVEEDEE